MLSYEFVILEVNGASCEFALDDIYWEGGVAGISDNDHGKNISASGFSLDNNYPDPFQTETTIKYTIPKMLPVELTVQDLTGRIVKTLVNETQSAGEYTERWSVKNEAPGIYIYGSSA